MNVDMDIHWLMTVQDVAEPIENGVARCPPVKKSIAVHRVFCSMDGWKILMQASFALVTSYIIEKILINSIIIAIN